MSAFWHDADPRHVLIFDFDGVVVHTEKVHFESWNATFEEEYGVRLEGDYTQVVGLTLDELMQMWTASGALPASVLQPEVQERLLARKTDHFFEIAETIMEPVAGVADLVHKAQNLGWYAAIASRGHRRRLLKTLEMSQIPAVFELVMTADHIVDPETDRKVHSLAAEALGAYAADCIVIEDSVGGIVDASNSAIGWIIGLTSSVDANELLAAGADETVDSLSEVEVRPPR